MYKDNDNVNSAAEKARDMEELLHKHILNEKVNSAAAKAADTWKIKI